MIGTAPVLSPEKSISIGGKRRRRVVAEHADVELAPFDVLLGQRGVAERLVDVRHAFHELLGVAHERALVDADRRVHAQRLDEERHAQVAAGLEVGLRVERGEVRVGNLLEREQLLRQRLVLLEEDLAGSAAGVGQLEQVEHARDSHRAAQDVVAERLDEIEHELRLALLQALDHLDSRRDES